MMMSRDNVPRQQWKIKHLFIAAGLMLLLIGTCSVVWMSMYVVVPSMEDHLQVSNENSPMSWMPSIKEPSSAINSNSIQKKKETIPPSLFDLVHTAPRPNCTAEAENKMNVTLQYFDSKFLADTTISQQQSKSKSKSKTNTRKIPKIIHLTSKSRCLSPKIYSNIQRWETSLGWSGDYSYLLHDDAAMERLLYDVEWPEFPHLQWLLQHCTTSGAAKADVWRALVLYHYGGIYSDIDNAPGVKFYNGTVITDDMDAYFLIEKAGIPSQYFFAAAPYHPLLYLLVQHCLRRLLFVDNVGNQYTPWVTGPGALKEAVMEFLQTNSSVLPPDTYTGLLGRNMTIDGGKRQSNNPSWRIIIRESIRGKHKKEAYEQMDMKHFNKSKKNHWKDTCLTHILKRQREEILLQRGIGGGIGIEESKQQQQTQNETGA